MAVYSLPDDRVHRGLLKKYQFLKGQILTGAKSIKGLSADEFVPSAHLLHDLIRGFYKPKDWKSILAYQATEKDENYGQQIIWVTPEKDEFKQIIMRPPSSERDTRAKSDIAAARNNMIQKYPIGILQNMGKGVNRVLGLGIITKENKDGNFIVEPVSIAFEKDEGITVDEGRTYFSIKTSNSDIVKALLNGIEEIEIGGLNKNEGLTKINDVVFLSFFRRGQGFMG